MQPFSQVLDKSTYLVAQAGISCIYEGMQSFNKRNTKQVCDVKPVGCSLEPPTHYCNVMCQYEYY
ncbi:Hypothetical predicted protein [Podarcis lilfordi]|uniref:Uncharacterized protein n=1 Tax=Podarcis lilfordi TaxID=74358 RepID=A0AA35L049_9SAUR|nr:Hypothetical predicted protein [Podarcis lilfordi]